MDFAKVVMAGEGCVPILRGIASVKNVHNRRHRLTIHVRLDVWVEDAVSDSIVTLIRRTVILSSYFLTYHRFPPPQALRDRVPGTQAAPLLHWGKMVRENRR